MPYTKLRLPLPKKKKKKKERKCHSARKSVNTVRCVQCHICGPILRQ